VTVAPMRTTIAKKSKTKSAKKAPAKKAPAKKAPAKKATSRSAKQQERLVGIPLVSTNVEFNATFQREAAGPPFVIRHMNSNEKGKDKLFMGYVIASDDPKEIASVVIVETETFESFVKSVKADEKAKKKTRR